MICSEEERKRLRIDEVLEACICRSPQGRALKDLQDFYPPSERDGLRAEFSALADIRSSLNPLSGEWYAVESVLGRFRNIEATVGGIKSGRLPDESELFELKRCFSLLRQLTEWQAPLAAAKVEIKPQDEAEALLNPPGMPSKGFHIYSAYSEDLTLIRQDKHLLEAKILQAHGNKRQKLLAERSLLVSEERQEELKQIRRLAGDLQGHMEDLQKNLAAVAILDFRLARARLAESWQAPQPEIRSEDQPVEILKAWHPLLRKNLEAAAGSFTRQSIVLEQGSTVITGLNMGGKSVALETFLVCLYLVQLAYCPPCEKISTPLFDFFIYMAENPGSSLAGLSSFGMEAARLREYFRLIEKGRALVVMDEPCRGTNPHEATAIVRAICRIYADSDSCLLLASHYDLPPGKAINHYQIRGLGDLSEEKTSRLAIKTTISDKDDLSRPACSVVDEDLEAVKRISQLMDYRLVKVEDAARVPAGAIRIAELMGIDKEALNIIREAYSELDK